MRARNLGGIALNCMKVRDRHLTRDVLPKPPSPQRAPKTLLMSGAAKYLFGPTSALGHKAPAAPSAFSRLVTTHDGHPDRAEARSEFLLAGHGFVAHHRRTQLPRLAPERG
jgi:hypothetical protein